MNCPKCDSDLRGEDIYQHFLDAGKTPEIALEYAKQLGWTEENSKCFTRKIGVYCRDRDRTIAWKCPDCGHRWERED